MHDLITERVWCCVCNGRGKVPKLLFWKRDCHICDGTGEREIVMDRRFPEDIKQRIRMDAKYGTNTVAALTGGNGPFGNLLGNNLF